MKWRKIKLDYMIVFIAKYNGKTIRGNIKSSMENSPPRFDEIIGIAKWIEKEKHYEDVVIVNCFPIS